MPAPRPGGSQLAPLPHVYPFRFVERILEPLDETHRGAVSASVSTGARAFFSAAVILAAVL